MLDQALDALSLPEVLAVPLLPGKTYDLKANTFLADSSRLTETFHVSTSSSPAGLALMALYWIWSSPLTVISPPKGLILCDSSTALVCTGSIAKGEWFSEVFGSRHNSASAVTLISYEPLSPARSQPPNLLFQPVEVYRVSSYLPPRIASPVPLIPTQGEELVFRENLQEPISAYTQAQATHPSPSCQPRHL